MKMRLLCQRSSITLLMVCGLCLSNLQGQHNGISGARNVRFIENRGQVHDQQLDPRPDVLYSGQCGPLVYHLLSQGVSYQLSKTISWKKTENTWGNRSGRGIDSIPTTELISRVDLKWVGSNRSPLTTAEFPESDVSNYYVGNRTTGIHDVKAFGSVRYRNVYRGVDLHYYSAGGILKYDFMVMPYSDYKQIKLEVSGASVKISSEGNAIISTPLGEIEEGAPVAYQEGKKLNGSWKLTNNVLSFEIPDYDNTKELLIDPPTRAWSTYFGTSGNEGLSDVCTDSNGDVYVCGSGNPATALATTGAFQTSYSGFGTCLLSKFDASGNRIWTTYYGSATYGMFYRITAYKDDYVFVLGQIDSTATNVVTSGVHQSVFGGGNDCMLVKFDANGFRQWGTYYGGAGYDWPRGLAADTSGNIYAAGLVAYYSVPPSTLFATSGAFQNSGEGGWVAKFDANGNRAWGTMYGDSLGGISITCATDKNNNLILAGSTGAFVPQNAPSLLSTSGAFQTQRSNYQPESFVAKFDPSGNRLWSTYAGSLGSDIIYDAAVDTAGNIFLAGTSQSSVGITTAGAYQNTFGGFSGMLSLAADGWLMKYTKNGVRVWSTYYGAGNDEEILRCDLDGKANVYLYGSTNSTSSAVFASGNAFQSSYGGGSADNFLAKFDSTGQRQWGTYYGGSGQEGQFWLGIAYNAGVYVTGLTTDQSMYGTSGSFQSANAGGTNDGYLSKFIDCSMTAVSAQGFPNQVCNSQTFTVTPSGANHYTIVPGNYTTMPAAVSVLATTIFTLIGGSTGCSNAATATFTVSHVPLSVSVSGGAVCAGSSFTISPSGASSYTYSSGNAVVMPSTTTSYSVWGFSQGCTSAPVPLTVTVNPLPVISVATSSAVICAGDTVVLTASGAQSYTWTNGPAQAHYTVSPQFTTLYVVKGELNGCKTSNYFVQSVNQCVHVGINEQQMSTSVYPNPCEGILSVKGEIYTDCKLKLFNGEGKLVRQMDLEHGVNTFDIKDLAKGLYMCAFVKDGILLGSARLMMQ